MCLYVPWHISVYRSPTRKNKIKETTPPRLSANDLCLREAASTGCSCGAFLAER